MWSNWHIERSKKKEITMKKLLHKWSRLSIEARSSMAFMIATFLTKGINFITTPIFSRLLTTAEYGEMANYNSWLSVLEPIAVLGLTYAGAFNIGLNEYKDSRKEYMSSLLGLSNLATIVVFVILFLLKKTGLPFIIMSDSLMMLMFIHFIFSPAQVFWITRERYEYRYKKAIVVTFLSAFLGQAMAIVAILLTPNNHANAKLWGAEIGTLCVYVGIYIYLIISGKRYVDLKCWKNVLLYAVPLIPHYIAQHIMASSDRIMLVNMSGNSAAGIYSLVASIGAIASILWSCVNASLVPYTYSKFNEKKYEAVNKSVMAVLIPYAILCFCVSLLAPEIIYILAPEEYYSGLNIVPYFAILAFTQGLYNVFANVEFYYKKTTYISASTMAATIINIILNAIMIPQFSFFGASIATVISSLCLVIFHYYGMKKALNRIKVYDIRKILLVLIFCIVSCLGCNFLYVSRIARYTVVLIVVVILICKHDKLVDYK